MANVKIVKPVATPVVKVAKRVVSEVTVTWNGGSRVYSRALHGELFLELAAQFAAQHPEAVTA